MTPARLSVDLGRIRANLDVLRACVAPAEVMLVVKDDAYAHGVDAVVAAAASHGISWIGSFDVATGLRARAAAPDARIFSWAAIDRDDVPAALDARLELGIGDPVQLEAVAAGAAGRGLPVHLKIDTGLHRNGVRPEDWPGFAARARELQTAGDIVVAGVWSHIAEASDEDDDDARATFIRAVEIARAAGLAPGVLHLAASAAGYSRPEFRHDLVRVGAFVYGIRSTDGPDLAGIVPAATLLAPVVGLGDDATTVGLGSLDGLPSTLGGRVTVGTPGGPRELLAVGATSCTVAAWPGAALGDDVAFFGPGRSGEHSPTTLAEAIGTVGEEILVRLSPLIPRDYVES